MNKIPRLIRIATAVIVAGGLAIMGLSAQDYYLDAVRQAADQGDANAQFNLGFMYANGEGVPKDDAEAARWYRMAANQGDAAAQYSLGVSYANGEGVRRTMPKPHAGTEWLPTRVTPMRSLTSGSCTTMAMVFSRTNPKP